MLSVAVPWHERGGDAKHGLFGNDGRSQHSTPLLGTGIFVNFTSFSFCFLDSEKWHA